MLNHYFYNIGKIYYADEEPVDILIRLQNKVQSVERGGTPQLLVITADVCDITKIGFTVELVDYDPTLEEKYLLGLTPGTATSYSLSLSPGWKEKGKKRTVKFKWIYNILRQKIKKTPIVDLLEDRPDWLIPLLETIKVEENQLQELVSNYLIHEGRTNFNQPLLFRIKTNKGELWQGEIQILRRLYELLFLGDIQKQGQGASCQFCGSTEGLRQGFQIGMYTTDQSAFVGHFFENKHKLEYQYLMCTDCYLLTLLGFSIVRDRLNFYAYSFRVKGKKQHVYHYLIPTAEDDTTIKNTVKFIEKAKRKAEQRRKFSLTEQIKDIDDKIKRIEAIRKKYNKKKVQDLRKHKDRLGERLNQESDELSFSDLLEQAFKEKTYPSMIDFYYCITNPKVTPKSKQVVGEIELTSEHLEELAKILYEAEKRFGPVGLSGLQDVVGQTFFLYYYSSLLSFTPIDQELFYKRVGENLRERFIHKLINYTDPKAKKVLGYRYPLRDYEKFEYMYSRANLWR